jgi:hypothetical protein
MGYFNSGEQCGPWASGLIKTQKFFFVKEVLGSHSSVMVLNI